MPDSPALRAARPDDYPELERIERDADALLIELFAAEDWPAATSAEERAGYAGFTLVAESAAGVLLGFVQVIEASGDAHLEQVSVSPAYGRHGIGRLLVQGAMDEASRLGYRELTLRTYRDVPWHARFYTSCGFSVSAPSTPFQRMLIDVETRLELERWGPRVQMTAPLPRAQTKGRAARQVL